MAQLSVIIATHCRASILKHTLDYLSRQTVADDLEVIVVSDGADKETEQTCEFAGIAVQFLSIPKTHQGVARNRGLEAATAPYTLYLNDDIFLEPDACERHLQALHTDQVFSGLEEEQSHPHAVLGFVTWDPACGITPVMEWLEESSWQFGFPMIEKYAHKFVPPSMQHRFCYTCNISLPTKIAREHLFREDITLYGWEDIEWGHRLKESGVGLFYEPEAEGLHHHHISLADSLKRMEILGESIVQLSHHVPDIDRLPRGLKRLAYPFAAMLPTMMGRHRRAFLKGIRKGKRES